MHSSGTVEPITCDHGETIEVVSSTAGVIAHLLCTTMGYGRRPPLFLTALRGGVRQKHDTLQPASLLLQSAEFLKAKIRPQIRKTVSYRETIKLLRV